MKKNRIFTVCLLGLLVVSGCLSGLSGVAAEARPGAGNPPAFLRQCSARLENRVFGREDHAELQRFWKRAKTECDRSDALALLAREERVMNGDPLAALTLLGPAVLPKARVEAWRQAQAAGLKVAKEKLPAADASAKPGTLASPPTTNPPPPEAQRLAAPFPAPAEWKVNGDNAPCAVELARCLLELGGVKEALAVIDKIGTEFEGDTRVLAAECAADLMVRLNRFDKGILFYEFAIRCQQSQATESSPLTEDQKLVLERMRRHLDDARRLRDIEAYGEGYVLYREAEELRRGKKPCLPEAVLRLEDLRAHFPRTVYAEAAACYTVKSLLALADRVDGPARVEAAVADAQKEVEAKKARLTAIRKAGAPEAAQKEVKAALKDLEAWSRRLAAVPCGEKALRAAEELAAAFSKENEFGLYRGETLLALADGWLEGEGDAEKALPLYDRAVAWFDQIGGIDASIEAFDVPGQAAKVSAPPPTMKQKDDWGNVKWTDLGVGKLFNRRTAAWYVPWHRMMARTRRGLCHFIRGEKAPALEDIRIILEVDEAELAARRTGFPNSYSRLKAEFEQGRMFATREELDLFKGRERTALMVAEYYFEIEDWQTAARLYRKFNRENRDRLGLAAKAYLDYQLGNCALMGEGDRTEAYELFLRFDKTYAHTPTWPRAMMSLFSLAQSRPGGQDAALGYLQRISKRLPSSTWGREAVYHQAEYLFVRGNFPAARKLFETCLEKEKGSWMARGSEQYLEKIRKGDNSAFLANQRKTP